MRRLKADIDIQFRAAVTGFATLAMMAVGNLPASAQDEIVVNPSDGPAYNLNKEGTAGRFTIFEGSDGMAPVVEVPCELLKSKPGPSALEIQQYKPVVPEGWSSTYDKEWARDFPKLWGLAAKECPGPDVPVSMGPVMTSGLIS